MPLFIGDYLADTIGLTDAQHGAYLKSMMAYWRNDGALTHRELSEVCGREMERVSRFYVSEGGKWHHKRIDKELDKARKRVEAAKAKSEKMLAGRRKLQMIDADL